MPQLDAKMVDDVIVGNAVPEAEQKACKSEELLLQELLGFDVAGVTVNRYCAVGPGNDINSHGQNSKWHGGLHYVQAVQKV